MFPMDDVRILISFLRGGVPLADGVRAALHFAQWAVDSFLGAGGGDVPLADAEGGAGSPDPEALAARLEDACADEGRARALPAGFWLSILAQLLKVVADRLIGG
jgi:hypothetical protein